MTGFVILIICIVIAVGFIAAMILFQNRMRARTHPAPDVNQTGSGHGGHGGGGNFAAIVSSMSWKTPIVWVAGIAGAILLIGIAIIAGRIIFSYATTGHAPFTREQARTTVNGALRGQDDARSQPASAAAPIPEDTRPRCPSLRAGDTEGHFCEAGPAGPQPIAVALGRTEHLCFRGHPLEHGIQIQLSSESAAPTSLAAGTANGITSFTFTGNTQMRVGYYAWPTSECPY